MVQLYQKNFGWRDTVMDFELIKKIDLNNADIIIQNTLFKLKIYINQLKQMRFYMDNEVE